MSEYEISLIEILAYEVKTHVDSSHEVLVPHQRVSKVADQCAKMNPK